MAHRSFQPIKPNAGRPGVRETLAHTGLVLLVLLATWLSFNTDQRTPIGAISTAEGVFNGLNAPEQSERGIFRWTDGAATICLPQAGHAERSLVQVSLAGDYALALGTNTASLRPGVGPTIPIDLAPGQRHYTLLTRAADQPGGALCLSVLSAANSDPNNNRRLGVPFYAFAAQQLPLAGPVTPAAGHVGLNLLLALTAFWLLRSLGVPFAVALALVSSATLLVAGALVSGLVPAGVNPARMQIPVVGGGLGALLGLISARRLAQVAPNIPRLARELLGMAFWSVLLVSGFRSLQWANGHSSVWPLKAGYDPNPTWAVLIAGALFAGWLWILAHQLRTQRNSPQTAPFFLLMLGAIGIPVALEVSILGWDALYVVFRDSEYDYLRDTFRVGDDPLGFLRTYVAQAPQMALHTSTHPPGSVLFLWAVERSIGPGAVTTSWVTISLSALIVLAAYWLGWRMGGPRLALLAGIITVAMPGQLIYNVTSMDGLFNALNALGAVAFFLALEAPARPRSALCAGALIALALFFTYATTQLAFFGLGAGAMALWRRPGWPTLRVIVQQGAIAAGTIGLIYLALFIFTGFDVISGSREATAENAQVMGRWLYGQTAQPFAPPSFAYYLTYLGANLAPYLWYIAPWGLAAVSSLLLAAIGRRWREASLYDALLVAVGACVLGMALSGLFNREVERIWGFTYPLLAVLIAHIALQGAEREQRWRSVLYPTLFFILGAAMKLLLNTVW